MGLRITNSARLNIVPAGADIVVVGAGFFKYFARLSRKFRSLRNGPVPSTQERSLKRSEVHLALPTAETGR